MTSGSLWNCYRNEIDDGVNDALEGKSFIYKTKIIGKTPVQLQQPAQPSLNPEGTQPQPPQQLNNCQYQFEFRSNYCTQIS